MSKHLNRGRRAALACALSLGIVTVASTAGATGDRAVTLPQKAAAHRAVVWLAGQVNAKGYIGSSGSPDLSDTTLAILALAAAGGERTVALRASTYVEGHIHAYAVVGGHDGAGQLATLILDAHVVGVNPTKFGGTNLVARLLATQRTSGADAGLFGVQDPTYDGAYRQGLALAALAVAGVRTGAAVRAGVTWLKAQQCPNGGWEAYRSTSVACTPSDPTTYSGPDTNSTALAVEGLVAQRATFTHAPVGFLVGLQASDGGWGSYGGSSDPDSTALVIQALVALHDSVSASRFRKGTKDPVTALLSFQLKNGAFYYPVPPNSPSDYATEQAVPALMSKAFPF
jgi:hypothetical protein